MHQAAPFVRQSGEGPAVLCLHSSAGSSAQWVPLMDRLSAGYRVIAPDLHAHGRNTWPGGGGNALEEDMRLVEAIAGDAPAHVVGHSYGGALALRYATRRPERVLSLVLYEPAVWHLAASGLADSATREVLDMGSRVKRLVESGNCREAARGFVDYWNGEHGWDRLSAPQQSRVEAQMPRIMAHFDAVFADRTPLIAYAGLEMPALLLSGGVGPRCGQYTARLLSITMPRTDARRFPALGHMGPVVSAAPVNEAIAEFIDRLSTMRSARRPAARPAEAAGIS